MGGYNYDEFSPSDYDLDRLTGPGVGEKAPDGEYARYHLATLFVEMFRAVARGDTIANIELWHTSCSLHSTQVKLARLSQRWLVK